MNKLPRTPTPYPDENFRGYMIRLTEDNGYDNPSTVYSLAGITIRHYEETPAFCKKCNDLKQLSDITGIDETVFKNMMPKQAESTSGMNTGDKSFSIYGQLMPDQMIRRGHVRICPDCLKETGYIKGIWSVAAVTVCPIHNNMLIDSCPKCGKKLNWKRNKVSICSCNYDLRNASARKIGNADVGLSRLIYERCGLLKIDQNAVIDEKNHLKSLGLEHIFELVIPIADRFKDDNATTVSRLLTRLSILELHHILAKSYGVFEKWPLQYHDFLDLIREQKNNVASDSGINKYFGNFYMILYKTLSNQRYDFMRSAFERYIETHWRADYRPLNGYLKKTTVGLKYMSQYETSKYLGCSRSRVKGLIKDGILTGEKQHEGKSTFYLIEKERAVSYRTFNENALTAREASAMLGISDKGLKSIVSAGCLTKQYLLPPHRFARQFRREEIEELLGKLNKTILKSKQRGSKEFIDYKGALHMIQNLRYNVGDLVRAMCSKSITSCGKSHKNGLAGFLFEKKVVSRFLIQQTKKIDRDLMSLEDAMKMIRIKGRKTMACIIKAGYLKATKEISIKRGQYKIHISEIYRFKSEYVLSGEIAVKLKIPESVVLSLAIKNGIIPISGPLIDGERTYLFNRRDINSIKHIEDFDYKELMSLKTNEKCLKILTLTQVSRVTGIKSRILRHNVKAASCVLFWPPVDKVHKMSALYFTLDEVAKIKREKKMCDNAVSGLLSDFDTSSMPGIDATLGPVLDSGRQADSFYESISIQCGQPQVG